jgi:hypothetical protein
MNQSDRTERHKSIHQILGELSEARRVQPKATRWPQLITEGGAIVSSAKGVVIVVGRNDPNYPLSGGEGITFECEREPR